MNTGHSIDENLFWSEPPDIILLRGDEIHIWCAKLDQTDFQVKNLINILASDEQARAGSFYFEKDKRHFIVARGLLRLLLGRYMHLQPDQLSFTYRPYGKPVLNERLGNNRPYFNLAHSRGLVYYAMSKSREVGIDVEYIRSDVQVQRLASQFFSARERRELLALPVDLQLQAFFNCWTRKEAFIKARGEGLSYPLSSFDVSVIPGVPANLLATHGDPEEASRWVLQDLPANSGYAAALAYEGPQCQLSCWKRPD